MPYLRRSILLLTISSSILLITFHLFHIRHPHIPEDVQPVLTKAEAEKSFEYLKKYDHPKQNDIAIPNPDYVMRIAYGNEKATPPKAEDVYVPSQEDALKIAYGGKDPKPKPDMSKVAPANATAWHKDKNMWKVADAAQG